MKKFVSILLLAVSLIGFSGAAQATSYPGTLSSKYIEWLEKTSSGNYICNRTDYYWVHTNGYREYLYSGSTSCRKAAP